MTIAPVVARVGKPARYTVMLVGLGATGVAIGWLGPQLTTPVTIAIKRR